MKSIPKESKTAYFESHTELFSSKNFDTKSVHMGQPAEPIYGSVSTPIHMTSIYAQEDPGVPTFTHAYGRDGNPTRDALETCISSLENAKHSLVTSSWMSSTLVATSLLKAGQKMVCLDDVWAATGTYFREILEPIHEIKIDYVDFSDVEGVKEAIDEDIKMVWMESPTNPLLKVYDIKAIAEICKEKDVILVVDNTLMSPYFQTPLDLGATIVIQSATKYLGGHSDVVMGTLATNDEELYKKLRRIWTVMGQHTSPMDCYLVIRSLKTFPLRMKKINKNGTKIAKFLEESDYVDTVYYPMLESHEGHELHKTQATGGAGLVW